MLGYGRGQPWAVREGGGLSWQAGSRRSGFGSGGAGLRGRCGQPLRGRWEGDDQDGQCRQNAGDASRKLEIVPITRQPGYELLVSGCWLAIENTPVGIVRHHVQWL
jgi:hypothetical protein